jgi:hypothetical protein
MSVVERTEVAANADPAWRASWVWFARWQYRLDQATAERWVFVRWLAETGRHTEARSPTRAS